MELKDKFTRHEKWAEDRRRLLRGTSGPSHATAWGGHAFIRLWLFSHSVTSDSFATPWTVARQAPLSMGFPRQECSSRLHFLLQGIFQDLGLNLCLLHWHAGSLPLNHQGSPTMASDENFREDSGSRGALRPRKGSSRSQHRSASGSKLEFCR